MHLKKSYFSYIFFKSNLPLQIIKLKNIKKFKHKIPFLADRELNSIQSDHEKCSHCMHAMAWMDDPSVMHTSMCVLIILEEITY